MTTDILTIPNPLKDLAPLTLDLSDINAMEARTMEIAVVSPSKAPELMASFNRVCFTLSRYYSELRLLKNLAEQNLDRRRAVVIIDVVPDIIKAKGLSNNETTRQALVDLDSEYQKLQMVHAQLDAATVFIEGKLRAMEGNINAVKKVLGENSGVYYRSNPNLNTGGFDNPIPTSSPTISSTGLAVGKAKY